MGINPLQRNGVDGELRELPSSCTLVEFSFVKPLKNNLSNKNSILCFGVKINVTILSCSNGGCFYFPKILIVTAVVLNGRVGILLPGGCILSGNL